MAAESGFDISGFLSEPRRMAQVAAVSPKGRPLLGSVWFLFAGGRFLFSSARESPLVAAATRGVDVAVLVDDFAAPERIRQIRVRGPASIETPEASLVHAIFERYLGPELVDDPGFFRSRATSPDWVLWSVTPQSGVAVSTPHFRGPEFRWNSPAEAPEPFTTA